ncbi:hypothetical protein [Franconibacter pulveris]|uniref:Uncharacterized protein n=1 Tax=Franconibacter pulveris TaxID=435910 RepID=A0A0J8Y9J2_9ENTR|nr:hypothetical protein [Franconibacter pulveris]KMV34104.1 hypothetical protein ACH50_13775 [Franconibacter pulveris]
MSKNDNEKLIDTVIGEAIIDMIESGKDISLDALTELLRENLGSEAEGKKQDAYRAAITGIHSIRDDVRRSKRTGGRLKMNNERSKLSFNSASTASKPTRH